MQVTSNSVCVLLSKFVYARLHVHCATTVQEGVLLSSPLCPNLQPKVLKVPKISYIIVEALKELFRVSHTTLGILTLCDMEGFLGAGGFQ